MQGMAFGAGSAVAHRAIGAAAGALSGGGGGDAAQHDPRQAAQTAQQQHEACEFEVGDFYQCLEKEQGNIGACQFYFDRMQQCRAQSMNNTDE